ncbi:T9SS type A sorting domain-containing protein [Dyadobacter arcticus]|uniref:Secretion system C-terminal sorting domain-containing protein n=1 Tax=Dyadobacter arcticus TaxID=1078754 RepID=A0ABX0UMN5_9BACT|nr:T9SS type A sorting domain-containing protein [Dyadobacter arcticus]NIJ53369.1 hypothetical protein [Dyadobacter arcticus]
MNFLLKMFFAVGMAGTVAAAPFEVGTNLRLVADSAQVESSIVTDLNHSYTINNPYAESADKPFTFKTKTITEQPAPLANKVSCGGRIWENGEVLGHTNDGKSMIVRLQDNRIYLNWGGTITDNIFVLFYLVENTFPNNPTNGSLIDACVNPLDPSTAAVQLLGRNSAGQITCKGYAMEDGDLLGTYVADWGETRQHVRVRNGLLRIGVQQGPNDNGTENLQMGLINFTIDGANGSYLAPKWRGVLTKEMANGCFWPRVPKPATPIVDANCASGPTVKTVTNVTQTSLQFTYQGSGVSSIKWKILSGSNTVANGTTGNLGSTTVNLSFGSLSSGNYKLVIEGGNCNSASSELNFTVPVAPVGNCISGPTVLTVTNITATSLRFTFNGLGVHTVKWKILSGTSTVANATTGNLTSSEVNISYGTLSPGNYKLVIEGGDCTSGQSEINFTVPGSTTPNCASGPTLKTVTNITPTSLRFTFDGVGVNSIKWKILSGANTVANNTIGNLSGSTVNLTFGSLSPGNYKLAIEGGNCISGQSEMNFTVPTPAIPDCIGGPSISTIKNISQTGLTVDFAGTNLQIFSWKVLQNSNEFGSGKTAYLNTKSTNLSFPNLAAGTYTLQLTPEDCKGTAATKAFVVPVAPLPPCTKGPNLISLTKPDKNSLTFKFDGLNVSAIDWKIMKGNALMRSNRVAPRSSSPLIEYTTLADGDYTLQIQGGNCTSAVSSADFKVDGTLPIYIANFEGEVVDKGVELSWEVVQEEDGKEFEVLRYDDKLKNETVLGKVSLTDQRVGWYHFVDERPLLGINYYQLKQIDIDGTFEKSKMIAINPGIITGRIAAPNPAQDYVDIQFASRTSGLSNVSIYNVAGLEVSSFQVQIAEGNNNHRLNVKKLIAGSYIIKISHNGELSKLRFLKVK